MIISGQAKLAGVMGWPISHSQSPRLHGYWLDLYKIDGAYLPLAVNPDNFEDVFQTLPKLGFRGVNVTVPHKEKALTLVDSLDPLAQKIGAVNTVVFSENGHSSGYNTDAFGFIENLTQGYNAFNPGSGPAVVLGSGGAARAVVCALIDVGVPEIRLVNRTLKRAEDLAAEISGNITPYNFSNVDLALTNSNLLVNTTSLGMQGNPPLDIDLSKLPEHALVNDIVYAPLQTELLKLAQLRGNPTVDGLGMLLHQARSGFEKWFGMLPEVTEDLRNHIIHGMSS
jgi:shikimate dehydrogenase